MQASPIRCPTDTDHGTARLKMAQDCQREGPIPESEMPRYVLEVTFGKGTADPPRGSVVDVMDLNFEVPKSPVQSAEGSN